MHRPPDDEPQMLRADDATQGSFSGNTQQTLKGSAWTGLFVAVALLAIAAWSVGLMPKLGSLHKSAEIAHLQPQPIDVSASVVQRVAPGDIDQAVSALMLSDADKAKIRSSVANGALQLGTITVSDFDTEDADWVSIIGAGFRQDVRLFKKPLTITVPYTMGAPIVVVGLVDGGGGDITVAIQVGASSMPLRAIKPGERVEIPTP